MRSSSTPSWSRGSGARIHEEAEQLGGGAVGLAARDTLRLEAGMPLYGHELTEQINPIQAGLGFAVNLQDHQFIGHDALVAATARQEPTGPRRATAGRQAQPA